MKTATVSFRLDPETHDEIRRLAEDLRLSQVSVVELGVALLGRLTREDLVRLAAERQGGPAKVEATTPKS